MNAVDDEKAAVRLRLWQLVRSGMAVTTPLDGVVGGMECLAYVRDEWTQMPRAGAAETQPPRQQTKRGTAFCNLVVFFLLGVQWGIQRGGHYHVRDQVRFLLVSAYTMYLGRHTRANCL